MTTTDAVSCFSRLEALGLIDDEQCANAAVHPRRDDAEAMGDPAQQLIWMVSQRIVSHADVVAIAQQSLNAVEDGPQRERNAVLLEVLPRLEALSASLDAQLFDALLADGLITQKQCEAMKAAPSTLALDSEAHALAYMVDCGRLTQSDVDAMVARAESEQACKDGARRLRIVEDAYVRLMAIRAVRQALDDASQSANKRRLPVSILAAIAMLFVGYHIYAWMDADPACDDSSVRKSVHGMVSSVVRKADPGGLAGAPGLSEIREVGYASARHQRGCSANLEVMGESIPFSYVIAPVPGEDGSFSIGGAQPALVKARFGSIGEDGDFGNKAEPIGRANLEAAMRAAFESGRARVAPAFAPDAAMAAALEGTDLQRTREIADIEPLGACRALQGGASYACRVMVERNDPVLSMLGQPSEIVEGEFTFERSRDGKTWQVAADFDNAFAHAVAASRAAAADDDHRAADES